MTTHTGPGWTLYQGDCLDVPPTLAAGSVDAVVTDPPYGTSACAWDSVIPLAPMWEQLRRIVKPSGAVVLFAAQPFTSALVMSNPGMFRQELVWDKVLPVGFLDANRRHLRRHENVVLFSANGYHTFVPQKTSGEPYTKPTRSLTSVYGGFVLMAGCNKNGDRYPTSILQYTNADRSKDGHPTQKPVDLLRYLIRTYTNPGETVLDFTMGSGTTGVAAIMEGRRFIGVELDPGYYAIAHKRIANAQPPLFVADEPAQPAPEQAAMFDGA